MYGVFYAWYVGKVPFGSVFANLDSTIVTEKRVKFKSQAYNLSSSYFLNPVHEDFIDTDKPKTKICILVLELMTILKLRLLNIHLFFIELSP